MKRNKLILATLLLASTGVMNLYGAEEKTACCVPHEIETPPYDFDEYDNPNDVQITIKIPQPTATPAEKLADLSVSIGPSLLDSTCFTPLDIPPVAQENKGFLLLQKTLRKLNHDQTIEGLPSTIVINDLTQHLIICGGNLMHTIQESQPINLTPIQDDFLHAQQPLYIACRDIVRLRGQIATLGQSPEQKQAIADLHEKYNSYLRDIVALSWYLYSESVNKDNLFTDGSFVILDENLKIYNYLMFYARLRNENLTCTFQDAAHHGSENVFAYSRASTHFKEEQINDTTLNRRHYGIDIRLDAQEKTLDLLPTGKKHILFGLVGRSPDQIPLLFIKFEDDGIATGTGTFIETAQKKLEWLSHVGGAIASTGRMLEKKCAQGSLARACVTATCGSNDGELLKKERTAVNFSDRCKTLLKGTGHGPSDSISLDTRGIKELAKLVANQPLHWTPQLHIDFIEYYEELCKQYDYCTIRTGNEVILGSTEFKSSFFYHYMARAIAAKEKPIERTLLCQLAYTSELIYNDLAQLNHCQQSMENIGACIQRIKDYRHLRQSRAHFDQERAALVTQEQEAARLQSSLALLEDQLTALKQRHATLPSQATE